MIKAFYANPKTYPSEVSEAFAFPEKAAIDRWRRIRDDDYQNSKFGWHKPGFLFKWLAVSTGVISFIAITGPAGVASKIIRNKSMPLWKYWGLRVLCFSSFAYLMHSNRRLITWSNPYSRGELK